LEGPPADERLRWRRGDDGCLCCSLVEADEEAVAALSPASKEPDLRGESQLIRNRIASRAK